MHPVVHPSGLVLKAHIAFGDTSVKTGIKHFFSWLASHS